MRTEIHLRYANGYRILEMFEDAETELSKIPPEDRLDDRSLAIKAALFQDCGKWKEMREAVVPLRERHPEEVDWWIAEAYATRRCRSVEEAREILLEGAQAHPEEPCISYNLGCYACVLGEREEALGRVRAAIELDPTYKNMALEDEDLEALRDDLR